MRRYAIAGIIDAMILSAVLVLPGASQNSTQPQNAQPFTIKTATEVVLVNVQVRDSKGNFVRDLKQEDFTITEDGKTQKILSIDVENTDVVTGNNDLQAVNLLGNLNGATATQIQAEVRQRSQQTTPTAYTKDSFRDRRLMVLFFDLTSMQPEEVTRGVKSAEKFVETQLRPSDLIAVVSLSTRFNTDQDFTNDKDDLLTALRKLDPDSANGFEDGAADTADDAGTDQTFAADDSETSTFNTDRKLDALRTMFETLQGIEQKKSVMYFSGGLRTSGIDNQTSLRAAVNAAVRSNTSIYPVDVRGLQAVVPGGDAGQRGQRGLALFNGGGLRGQFTQLRQSQDTLVTLAADTGGKAFTDTNDFGPAFTKVQEDTSMYYVLSYVSSNTVKDGKFRQIRVTVKGKDLRVEARRGYNADTDFQHLGKDGREKQMRDELAADLPSTDLPVYLATGYFKLDDTRYFVPASIVVPGSAIPFARESDQDKATIDILGAVLDLGPSAGGRGGGGRGEGPRGGPPPGRDLPPGIGPPQQQQGPRIFGQIKDTVKLSLNASEGVKGKNIQYEAGFLLPPGRFTLRFIVRENETGQVGSFETDIFIPNLLQAPVQISSVIASSQKRAGKTKKDNPLTRNGTELIPNVTHVFSKSQTLYLFYEVYDPKHPDDAPANNKTAARLVTNVTFYQGDTKVFETPVVEVNQINTPDRKAAAVELEVSLAELNPGFYTCQVNVIDDAAGQFVFPRLSLLVR